MLSLSLGPIALPVPPVLLALAVALASWLARRLVDRQAPLARGADAAAAGDAVLVAAALGLLAARAGHLALNVDLYLADPWATLDVRDGGWHAPAGIVMGIAWLVWRGLRVPAFRRPFVAATLAGAAFWSASSLLTDNRGTSAMPATSLVDLASGEPLDLRRAAAGRAVVVNLWASWCGPCRQEMPVLAAAQQAEGRVGFLFVNQGESDAVVRRYLASLGLPLREVLLDGRAALGPAVGSRGLPTTLFYDAHGRLVDAHFGVLNAPALQSRLRALRAAR